MKQYIDFIYLLLETLADIDLSPVMTPRCLYVFFAMLYNSNTFFKKNIIKTKNFPSHSVFLQNKQFMHYSLLEFIINDVNKKLLNNKLDSFNFLEWFNLNSSYISYKNSYSKSLNRAYGVLTEYSTILDNDGWKLVNTPIDLPNGNFHITTEQIQNDIPSNGKWCPLNVNGVNKAPLHPSIHFISKVIDNDYFTEFETYYNNITQEEKDSEFYEVFKKSLTLSDEEKSIAEFWAGGSNTIKPPGFWNFFLYVYYYNIYTTSNTSFDVSSKVIKDFFILNASLFQAGLCVWYAKYQIIEQRPIQYIRKMTEEAITSFYFGDITTTKKWLPYQERNFVTPPFPDYVSGHSTFSCVGCEILNKLIGENLLDKNLKIEGNKLKVLSPLFKNEFDETIQLTCINVYPKTSTIIENVYPTKMVNLRFNTWTDMSIQAGLSRIYGGIHINSSNYPGMIVGKMIVEDVLNEFKM